MHNQLTEAAIMAYKTHLTEEERSAGTIEKYLRDIRNLAAWLNGRELSKDQVVGWKNHLLGTGYQPTTINSMLVAVNRFLDFLDRRDCRVKLLRIQRRAFCDQSRELTRAEFDQLLRTAQSLKKERLALLLETICATGIRVSEVRYITLEAVRAGRADISLKGKIRTILLPRKLCRKLEKYAKRQKIASGEVFLTRSGKGLSRKQIWAEMKALCRRAGVSEHKVFPHNLRHLFARTFYKATRDVAKLADVLGHSSIETTRIYLITTGREHLVQMEALGLVS